jgi:ureidoglycolate lyase
MASFQVGTPRVMLSPARQEDFAPYGQITDRTADAAIVNNGTALRYDIGAMDADHRPGSRLICSVFEATPQRLPLLISMLERHSFSAQAIVPMQEEPFVLAACLSNEEGLPDLDTLRAFLFRAGQGAIYAAGIWHYPIIGLERPSRFFVQSWQDGSDLDCEIEEIEQRLIALPPT